MADHHKEGMSRWTSFAECPYFAGKTGRDDTAASNFGTRAHAALEARIKGVALPAVTSDEREVAEWAEAWLRDYAGEHTDIHSETRVVIRDEGKACDGIFGTCDVWFVLDGQLHVADFKSIGFSDRDHSPQLKGYAYALATDPKVKFDRTKPVHGMILHGGSHYVSHYEFTAEEAVQDGNAIIETHRAACEDQARTCWSCQFCAHYPCTAVSTQLATIEKRWATKSLFEAMALAKICEQYAKSVTETVKRVLEDGGTVIDPATGARWEMVPRKGAAPLRDIDGLANVMIGRMGIDRDRFLSMIRVSKTALIDAILEQAVKDGSPLTKREAGLMIDPYFGEAIETKILKFNSNKKGSK